MFNGICGDVVEGVTALRAHGGIMAEGDEAILDRRQYVQEYRSLQFDDCGSVVLT